MEEKGYIYKILPNLDPKFLQEVVQRLKANWE